MSKAIFCIVKLRKPPLWQRVFYLKLRMGEFPHVINLEKFIVGMSIKLKKCKARETTTLKYCIII